MSSERHATAFSLCRRAAGRVALLGAALLLFSCSAPTVKLEVPPRVDLHSWKLIGVVDFSTNAYPSLARQATDAFVQDLSAAQPGARLLELGSANHILGELGRATFDPGTIRAMGSRYHVDAVLLGHLEVSGMTPDIHVSPDADSFSAAAKVHGDLSVRLLETATGAIVWSSGAHGQWSLGGLRYQNGGLTALHYDDPGDQTRKMIRDLAWTASDDFRPTFEQRRVGR